MSIETRNFDTLAIHSCIENDINKALNQPINMSSTFTFDNLEQANDTFDFKNSGYVYTRGNNPTINILEKRISILEHGESAVAFSSGMSAISGSIMSIAGARDKIIAHRNLYGSTYSFLSNVIKKYDINTTFIDMTKTEEIESYINSRTKIIYFETPSNPSLDIIDIRKVSEIAKRHSIKTIVDNTFATPYFQNPLELGIDIVLHSATKYLCGHGDSIGGLVTSKDIDYIHNLKFGFMCEFGSVISPFNAWLILRGIKTLSIRMEKHQQNAIAVTEYLLNHNIISKVLYPGLDSHTGHNVAKNQMSGFGGIVSFEMDRNVEYVSKFVSNLRMIKLAVSLGDTETLVNIPHIMTHRGYMDEELERFGFSMKTIRLSIGLEHISDIVDDIDRGLISCM